MSFLFYAGWILTAAALGGAAYTAMAVAMAPRVLRRRADPLPDPLPAVTILKPLYGGEAGLEDALASFFAQDYSAPVQIVFGLHGETDPARKIAENLKRRFSDRDIAIVIDVREHGSNAKVSNLVNMMAAATHDVLVMADSDIRVSPLYLKSVVAALARPGAGAVSCLYRGEGLAGYWSQLVAMGLGYHFLPNALFAIASGMAHPSFGSTIALSRKTLSQIGGFEAFADFLADDYEIGRAVRARGLEIAYPPLTVTHQCDETSLRDLAAHELRWQRTIRTIDPAGHWGSTLTHPLALGLCGAALLGFSPASCVVLATVLAARLFLKARIDHIVGASAGPLWLLPVRDVLSFGLFAASLFGNAVSWRGSRLNVGRSGAMSKS